MSRTWKIILTVAIVLIILFFGLTIYSQYLVDHNRSNSVIKLLEFGDACPEGPALNRFPIDLSDDDIFVPLGNLNPSGGHVFPTNHFYVQSLASDPEPKTLYAPGDIEITNISFSENITEGIKDYSINYRVCDELEGYFFHVDSLSPRLEQILPDDISQNCDQSTHGEDQYRQCWAEVSTEVDSGEEIGKVWEGKYKSFDIGFTDFNKESAIVANENRWQDNDSRNAVCLLDYLPKILKESLNKRFKDYQGNQAKADNPCNKVIQDIPGSAQGAWFNKEAGGNSNEEDPNVALVHDNFNPSLGAFSIGNGFEKYGIEPQVFLFQPQDKGSINREFSQVNNDGQVYCYSNFNEDPGISGEEQIRVLIQLTDDKDMIMEVDSDGGCQTKAKFSDNIVKFER